MNEKDFTLIHNYFNGLLSPQDVVMVEQRVMRDEVFKQEFELQKIWKPIHGEGENDRSSLNLLQLLKRSFFRLNKTSEHP